ncbi:hypothetical protein H9P43_006581 [Blastocladiella emersonii ATCC 22665]|nr:hypothetical protein H9P43_006581 [Blastocladiella emersonii ATCC 22665]
MDPSSASAAASAAVPVAGRVLAVDTVAHAARTKKVRDRLDRDVDEFVAKARGWEIGVEVDTEPTALAALAARAFAAMKISAASQTVVFRGDGGVDKQSQVALFLNHVNALSSKKAHKVHHRITAAQTVLAALGTAQTATCNHVTRFGQYTEIQFDDKHKIVGAKTLEFALDKARVTRVPAEERSFHIFYYLLAGATPEQKQAWKLHPDPAHYDYLHAGLKVIERSDADNFGKFLNALKTLGLSKKSQSHVLAVLAAVLHLGQIQFVEAKNQDTEEPETRVRNRDHLEFVAGLLGIAPAALEDSLLSHTGYIGVDKCTIVHNLAQATEYTAHLASTLYALLFTWLTEFINSRLHCDAAHTMVNVLAFPGAQPTVDPTPTNPNGSGLWAALANLTEHRLDKFTAEYLHGLVQDYSADAGSARPLQLGVPAEPDTRAIRRRHAAENVERISLDVVQLFRTQCTNEFVSGLFALKAVAQAAAAQAHVPAKPLRKSSIKRKSRKGAAAGADASADDAAAAPPTLIDEHESSLTELLGDVAETNVFLVYCGNSASAAQAANAVAQPLQAALGSPAGFPVRATLARVVARYGALMVSRGVDESRPIRDRVDMLLRGVGVEDHVLGRDSVWLTWRAVALLERDLKRYKEWKKAQRNDDATGSQYSVGLGGAAKRGGAAAAFDDGASYVSEDETYMSDNNSMYDGFSIANGYSGLSKLDGSGGGGGAGFSGTGSRSAAAHDAIMRDAVDGFDPNVDVPRTVEEPKASPSRRRWVAFVWLLTFWIPSFMLSLLGRMKDKHVQMAWREKVVICFLIFLFSAAVLFVIAGAGLVICPRRDLFSANEMDYLSIKNKMYASAYGIVYDLNQLSVVSTTPYHTRDQLRQFTGTDITSGFPRTPADYCPTLVKDKTLKLDEKNPNKTGALAIAAGHENKLRSDPAFASRLNSWLSQKTFRQGFVAIPATEVLAGWGYEDFPINRIIVKGVVYDLTNYYQNVKASNNANEKRFLAFDFSGRPDALNIDTYISNQASKGMVDLTDDEQFMKVWNGNAAIRDCFNALFTAGLVDERQTIKCLYADYILLAMSVVLCSIILFKFLASLQLRGGSETPEKMDKFVMIQVPCYTEDELSMSRTINSIAAMKYDDKRKLMLLICDGMIVGRGNDRPTPRIVLDLLGVDPSVDPEPLSYQAVGEGSKQHNMGKVYSGLYEYEGHLVPYVVLVKCGRPSETQRPGNRGKRDSQIMLMRFLNHLHYEKPMSPLELELRHHIQNVIGVDPKWYEYCLMIDADTTVAEEALTQLVAFCMTDTEIIGACGETKMMNEKSSVITMIQPYEYFISHHLAKAFESLFGSVTCLPGCFCMYRIVSANKGKPLLCHDSIVDEYSDCRVNTLHKKNLLHLGEDRFLTTLILKTFPSMRTKFTPSALAYTFAPETFSVLISQRRRWINSTFHNLVELVWIKDLCDLIYLTVNAIVKDQSLNLVMISLILIAAMYGLQAIVFILKKEFAHVVWMLIYILSIPIYGFYLPLYAFWRQDDFSWGIVRQVKDEKSKEVRLVREEDEYFDISQIKHLRWDEYQAEVMDSQSQASRMTDLERERELREMREMQQLAAMNGGGRPMSILDGGVGIGGGGGGRPTSMNGRPTSMGSSRSLFLPGAPNMSPAIAPAAAPMFGMPTDAELVNEIHRILRSADLMRITKKQVREELSALFGVDLSSRKDFINMTIDAALRDSM